MPIDARAALANERTFLAWIRCALALVIAGTTVGVVANIDPVWLHVVASVVPLIFAAIVALLGFARWRRMDTALRDRAFVAPDRSLTFVALVIALAGVVAGGVVLARVLS